MVKNLLVFVFIFFSVTASANNIQVANVSLQEETENTRVIQFNVMWENSWRSGSGIHDGAWIVAKYRKTGASDEQPWQHCTLGTGSVGGSGAVLEVTEDKIGAFVYRENKGAGTVTFNQNRLVWDVAADGVLEGESVEVKVFALEMVYIPKGPFYIGTSYSENYHYYAAGTANKPYYIDSNDEIQLGAAPGSLMADISGWWDGTILADYPKGYNAFWSMKYEITVQQFVDFLNHIPESYSYFNLIDIRHANQYFHEDITGEWPELKAEYPNRAMNTLSQNIFIDMARWSGLRPMSELEFEKICRGGDVLPLQNEYVWGTTEKILPTNVLNYGEPDEIVLPAESNSNARFTLNARPLRVGIFALSEGTTRESSGAAYYGVMNMGDNVREWVGLVDVTHSESPLHEKEHGLGQFTFDNITTDHFSQTILYPKSASYYYESYIDGADRTSDRSHSVDPNNENKDYFEPDFGGRFVRTAD